MSEQTAFSLPIKLVALDVDGTLLNSQHQMTDRTAKAIKAALKENVQVMLATGKTRRSNEWVLEELGLDGPGIFVGGCLVYDGDGTIRDQEKLSSTIARQLITFAEDRGYDVLAYSGDRLLLRDENPILDIMREYGEPEPEIVGPLQNRLDTVTVNKLLFYNRSPQKVRALRWQLSMQSDGAVKFTQTSVAHLLEVLPKHASKGIALRRLLKSMNIKSEQVMVVGDSENDLEMIESVTHSVAVGNASEQVKNAAKYTVATNDEDGVAEAFERFVLREPLDAEAEETSSTVDMDTGAPTAGQDQSSDQPGESETALPKPEDMTPSTEDSSS